VFTFPGTETRFLGDLYQDLSEAVRKRYALLQTPDFVEKFILEQTLAPAIEEFGLAEVKLIDPTCGSGHFLLGAFRELLAAWQAKEPMTPVEELAAARWTRYTGWTSTPTPSPSRASGWCSRCSTRSASRGSTRPRRCGRTSSSPTACCTG
jgi:hypothetical protein